MTLSLVGGLSNIPQGSLVIYLLIIVLNLNIQMAANINMSNIVITVTDKKKNIPKIVATFVYASSQGQRTHFAQTNMCNLPIHTLAIIKIL